MRYIRLLLLPLSLVYWLVTALRNFMYNKGLFKGYAFATPVIAIGNLTTGGTGKTPQTEYLIRLLAHKYKVATLSRGYKRKSKGFVLGSTDSGADTLGDEPYQFYYKFPNIRVAVDANRKNGIEQLLVLHPKPQVILLDDAYQHRRVKAGLYILLTVYNDLFTDDFLLPAGNLREGRIGAGRACIIIVTKCPPVLSEGERNRIIAKINPLPQQEVFFSYIDYDDRIYSDSEQVLVKDILREPKLLVAGIAKPEPFFKYLHGDKKNTLTYADHHDFTHKELEAIKEKAGNTIIITTEKDYVRLRGRLPLNRLFYLPIKSTFIDSGDKFDEKIIEYIKKI